MENKRWIRRKPETMLDWIIVACAAIAFYMLLHNAEYFMGLLGKAGAILSPFAGGVVIAYAINPIDMWVHKKLLRGDKRLRWLSMLVGYLVAILIVGGLGYLIVTQVFTSIKSFASALPAYTRNLEAWLVSLTEEYPDLASGMGTAIDYVQNLSGSVGKLLSAATSYAPQIMGYFSDVTATFVTVFTALASSIYLLTQKEKLLRHIKILTRAFLPGELAETILRISRKANRNLSGFFSGKIIDSAIIGVLTFVMMSIFRMSYAPLISIIVGVTNIIPVFGPFIGAIPGLLILLFLDPAQALGFAVLILFIQQLDGNVIGPKILGDSIGIDALWVLFSIVVCGDLFGLVGMVIGVPLFATIMGLVKEFAQWCLQYRGIDKQGNPLPHNMPDPADPADDDDALLTVLPDAPARSPRIRGKRYVNRKK